MYATCLHCHRSLGRNAEIELFPVGARLAFDSARGRLWVVCPACARWNLSPLEERWEAVEWCERAYRETATRVATDEIGLARRKSGLELIRVGRPLRPEFAAWRYGRQLTRRHRQAWVTRARDAVSDELDEGVTLARAALTLANPAVLLVGAVAVVAMRAHLVMQQARPVRGVMAGGAELPLRVRNLATMRLLASEGGPPGLLITDARGMVHELREGAVPLLGRLLVHVNNKGGNAGQVDQAVAKIEHFGPERLLGYLASRNSRAGQSMMEALGREQLLALEMVAHEETERRAMEGELHLLADAWRDAEEIAGIADDLLVPASIRAALTRAGRRRAPG